LGDKIVTDFELDQEEQEILEAFAAGEFVSELTLERRAYLAQLAEASANALLAQSDHFRGVTKMV
jgi:hypothetical protein